MKLLQDEKSLASVGSYQLSPNKLADCVDRKGEESKQVESANFHHKDVKEAVVSKVYTDEKAVVIEKNSHAIGQKTINSHQIISNPADIEASVCNSDEESGYGTDDESDLQIDMDYRYDFEKKAIENRNQELESLRSTVNIKSIIRNQEIMIKNNGRIMAKYHQVNDTSKAKRMTSSIENTAKISTISSMTEKVKAIIGNKRHDIDKQAEKLIKLLASLTNQGCSNKLVKMVNNIEKLKDSSGDFFSKASYHYDCVERIDQSKFSKKGKEKIANINKRFKEFAESHKVRHEELCASLNKASQRACTIFSNKLKNEKQDMLDEIKWLDDIHNEILAGSKSDDNYIKGAIAVHRLNILSKALPNKMMPEDMILAINKLQSNFRKLPVLKKEGDKQTVMRCQAGHYIKEIEKIKSDFSNLILDMEKSKKLSEHKLPSDQIINRMLALIVKGKTTPFIESSPALNRRMDEYERIIFNVKKKKISMNMLSNKKYNELDFYKKKVEISAARLSVNAKRNDIKKCIENYIEDQIEGAKKIAAQDKFLMKKINDVYARIK
ncbi:MAG: hypothetical protein PUP46_10975 [Endozoicomonas sp. (ex Botrylloides leachii)]|nr:hypothetical protein [Endozoicomonas sp. (ex Botrylloides leachii)]